MKIIETVQSAQAHVRERRVRSVLVPTMGALHRGHLELMRQARQRAGEKGEVALSIFVNPLQFEPGSDFEGYPRRTRDDEQLCRENGVDLLFRPAPNEMYTEDRSVFVDETSLSARLCGASRPGHFRGVCTVVAKLFNLLAPTAAVFGEKDYQQLTIVRRMVRDLNFAIEVIGLSTIRETDGLALSSRNSYLTELERADATVLFRALKAAKELVRGGEISAAELLRAATDVINSVKNARIDYISVVDGDSLQPVKHVLPNARMMLAVFIGKTRLIDNMSLSPAQDSGS